MSRLQKHTISVKHAFEGIVYTLKTQPNFQVHFFFAILATLAGFFFQLTRAEWAVIIFIIGLVLIAEMINTSIEAVVDLHTDKFHDSAKIAKDVSAGMVLITAIMAVVTGLLIFLPHLMILLNSSF